MVNPQLFGGEASAIYGEFTTSLVSMVMDLPVSLSLTTPQLRLISRVHDIQSWSLVGLLILVDLVDGLNSNQQVRGGLICYMVHS